MTKPDKSDKPATDKPTTPPVSLFPVKPIPVALIDVDQKKNFRLHLTDIPELAASIRARALPGQPLWSGQQVPVIVEGPDDKGRYRLMAGFRRFAAIAMPEADGGLAQSHIRAQVQDINASELSRMLDNLVENLAREDLSTYETARALFTTLEQSKIERPDKPLTHDELAARLGKSSGYVSNLLRAYRNLPEPALRRWEAEQSPGWDPTRLKVCTQPNINRWAREGLTAEERLALYNADVPPDDAPTDNAADDGGDDEDGGDGGGGSGRGNQTSTRAGVEDLQTAHANAAIVAARSNLPSGLTHDYYAGVSAALAFALGKTKTLKGVNPLPAAKGDDKKTEDKKKNARKK